MGATEFQTSELCSGNFRKNSLESLLSQAGDRVYLEVTSYRGRAPGKRGRLGEGGLLELERQSAQMCYPFIL